MIIEITSEQFNISLTEATSNFKREVKVSISLQELRDFLLPLNNAKALWEELRESETIINKLIIWLINNSKVKDYSLNCKNYVITITFNEEDTFTGLNYIEFNIEKALITKNEWSSLLNKMETEKLITRTFDKNTKTTFFSRL